VQSAAANLDGISRHEVALADEDVDTQVAKALRAVVATDASTELAHALHDRPEVASALGPRSTESGGSCSGFMPGPCCTDHCLRGHTAMVEAVATHETSLDQGHTSAESGRSRSRDESGGASSENDQVIPLPGLGVDPLWWVDIVEQSLVVAVEWLHQFEQFWDRPRR
jgi:hypothetical protein